MLTIGLTGGYATGKSVVAQILQSLGAVVADADKLSHEAIRQGEPAWHEAVRTFGRQILDPDGEIDRAVLGRLIFADPEARAEIEKIVHPEVIAVMQREADKARSEGAAVFVCEAPLLFEVGLAGEFDRVWVVSASPSRQMERAMARDRLTPEDARIRVAAQMPLADKERRADLVLRNEGDVSELRRQVVAAWEETIRGSSGPARAGGKEPVR